MKYYVDLYISAGVYFDANRVFIQIETSYFNLLFSNYAQRISMHERFCAQVLIQPEVAWSTAFPCFRQKMYAFGYPELKWILSGN